MSPPLSPSRVDAMPCHALVPACKGKVQQASPRDRLVQAGYLPT